jgi:hypothetical protein
MAQTSSADSRDGKHLWARAQPADEATLHELEEGIELHLQKAARMAPRADPQALRLVLAQFLEDPAHEPEVKVKLQEKPLGKRLSDRDH